MAEIDLLGFFRTGTLAGVTPGISRREVESILGVADDYYRRAINGSEANYETSPIWIYGGIELVFVNSQEGRQTNTLQSIDFKPFYLFRRKFESGERYKIRRWIFRSQKGPTKQKLLDSLSRHSIPYKDTGLEMLIWNEDISNFQVVEYEKSLIQSPTWKEHGNECFGTVVLKSGVQIRYDEIDAIQRVAINPDWEYKGKEVYIIWSDI